MKTSNSEHEDQRSNHLICCNFVKDQTCLSWMSIDNRQWKMTDSSRGFPTFYDLKIPPTKAVEPILHNFQAASKNMPVYIQSESPRTLQHPIQETITPHRHSNSHQQQVSEPMSIEYSNSPRNRNDWKKLTIFISDKLSVKFFFYFQKDNRRCGRLSRVHNSIHLSKLNTKWPHRECGSTQKWIFRSRRSEPSPSTKLIVRVTWYCQTGNKLFFSKYDFLWFSDIKKTSCSFLKMDLMLKSVATAFRRTLYSANRRTIRQ